MSGLLGNDRHTRKVAKYDLVSAGDLCPECPWDTYWQIYDAAEEYSGHLLKSLISQLVVLEPHSTCGGSKCLCNSYLDILVKRICVHENDGVVKHAVNLFTDKSNQELREWLGVHSSVFSVIEGLEKTPAIFNNKADLDRISEFLSQFVSLSGEATKFVIYALKQAKPYFPISYCYLQTISQLPVSAVEMDTSALLTGFQHYTNGLLKAFEAVLRPVLLQLIAQTIMSPSVISKISSENAAEFLALIPAVGKFADDLSTLQSLASSFIPSYVFADTVIDSVPFDAVLGASIVGVDKETMDAIKLALSEARDRLYCQTEYQTRLVNVTLAFQNELSFDEMSCVIDWKRLDVLRQIRPFRAPPQMVGSQRFVDQLSQLMAKCDALSDDEIYSLTYLLTWFVRAGGDENIDSETLLKLLTFTPRRISEEVSGVFFVSKWQFLSRHAGKLDFVSIDDLIEHISLSDFTYLEDLLEFTRAILRRPSFPTTEFVKVFVSTMAYGLLTETANEHCVSPILEICLLQVDECVDEILVLMRKLMKLPNPFVGRSAISALVPLIRNLSKNQKNNIVSEFLSDLLIHKEPFDEASIHGYSFGKLNSPTGGIEATSAYVRITTLVVIKELEDQSLIREIIKYLLKRIKEYQEWIVAKKAPQTPLPFTPFHQTQLRVYQAICYLAPLVSKECFASEIEPDLFGPLLTWANQPDARDYLESLAIYFVIKFQWPLKRLVATLNDFTLSSQAVASFVVIGGYLAAHISDLPDRHELMTALVPFLSSNIAYIRGLSQMWLFEANARQLLPKEWGPLMDSMIKFVSTNKESVQMRSKLTPVFSLWDPVRVIESGEIISLCSSGGSADFRNSDLVPSRVFIDAVRAGVHEALQDNWFFTRDLLSLIEETNENDVKNPHVERSRAVNSQKKYAPPSQDERRRKETDLIVVTSLVEKVTNIAGLCRTAEVFGAAKLVVPSVHILKDPQFSSMSVTAEQWIDIEEVCLKKLERFLIAKKNEGYTIVCLEQTHDSVEIQTYPFPNPKTVLVLGNEKNGVPVDILPLMDVCIEIPQRGVIRSLNVHVSGAIAMWQYNASR